MSSMGSPQQGSASTAVGNPYQDQLMNFCRNNNIRPPQYQVISDRRGGRTAWSCTVNVQGQNVQARFWYDGQYVNNAREDAAQMALQRYGQLPGAGIAAGVPPQPPQNPQPRNYGVIGN